MENFAAEEDCIQLNVTYEQVEQMMNELHTNINNFTPYPLKLVLPITTLVATALLNIGPTRMPPIKEYIG
jgi:hypothetical protein